MAAVAAADVVVVAMGTEAMAEVALEEVALVAAGSGLAAVAEGHIPPKAPSNKLGLPDGSSTEP